MRAPVTSGGGSTGEWRAHGTTVIAAALGVTIASMPFYAIGAFIAPLEAEFGWSRAQVVSGQIAISAIGILFTPLVGIFVDRWGPRWIGIAGSALLCSAFALLSMSTGSIWGWWAQWTLLACGSLLVTSIVWTSAVSSLFTAGRGLALAVALCGGGLAAIVFPIASTALIEASGWRDAFAWLGAAVAAVALPTMLLFLRSGRDVGRMRGDVAAAAPVVSAAPPPGLEARAAFATPQYVKLVVATLAITLAAVPFVVHLIPILGSGGSSPTRAAQLAGLVGFASIFGRLSAGWMLDRFNGPLVGAISVLFPIGSALLLLHLPGAPWSTVLAVLLLGMSLGAELDVISYLSTRYFGMRRYGTIYGTISAVLVLATGIGPVLAGAIFDATGSYDAFLWAVVPLCLLASLTIGTLGRYPVFADGPRPTPHLPARGG